MVRRYEESDYGAMVAMCESHGIVAPPESMLPKIGFIKDGVAVGFLYLTDSSVAIIDNFITAKQAEREARGTAMDEIVANLINAARRCHCDVVKCDTNIYAIKERAVKHGFEPIGSFQAFMRRV